MWIIGIFGSFRYYVINNPHIAVQAGKIDRQRGNHPALVKHFLLDMLCNICYTNIKSHKQEKNLKEVDHEKVSEETERVVH